MLCSQSSTAYGLGVYQGNCRKSGEGRKHIWDIAEIKQTDSANGRSAEFKRHTDCGRRFGWYTEIHKWENGDRRKTAEGNRAGIRKNPLGKNRGFWWGRRRWRRAESVLSWCRVFHCRRWHQPYFNCCCEGKGTGRTVIGIDRGNAAGGRAYSIGKCTQRYKNYH